MIKWNRSDSGSVESKCGRFEIEPLFMGRTTAQAFHVYCVRPGLPRERVQSYANTQREAKESAERYLSKLMYSHRHPQ